MNAGVVVSRAVIAHHSKSFALASRLLAKGCRDDASVVYAWCRFCDDAVDGAPVDRQKAALSSLREALDSIYDGQPQTDPVLASFQDVTVRWQIPKRYPSELLAGMQMDANGTRYETVDQLLLYCHRVAGTVGLMMSHVMGVSNAATLRNAAHLGIAMQLTNIARDVVEDWDLGRLYLPADMLGATDLPGAPEPGTRPDPRTRSVFVGAVRALLELSDRFYRSGDRGLRHLSFRSALAVRAARLVYSAIGTRLARRGYDPLPGRVHTSTWHKVWLLFSALCEELWRAPRRLGRPFVRAALPDVRFPDDILPLDDA
jgi:phytoene synthase